MVRERAFGMRESTVRVEHRPGGDGIAVVGDMSAVVALSELGSLPTGATRVDRRVPLERFAFSGAMERSMAARDSSFSAALFRSPGTDCFCGTLPVASKLCMR